jgi:hypothetical protein
MAVTAKFFVQTITRHAAAPGQHTVVLAPVSRGEENKNWSKYTPSGKIEMNILNEVAASQFVLGEEYLLTFEHAPKPDVHGPALGHSVA